MKAIFSGPKRKYERRFGIAGAEKSKRHIRRLRKAKSEYGKQLEEKQKLKFIYGILERQMRIYAGKAMEAKGNSAEIFLRQIEMRLDNIVFRLGFASTRAQARQLVNHRHIFVDGRKTNIPSYQVSPGQNISLEEKMLQNPAIKKSIEESPPVPDWLERKANQGFVKRYPDLEELPKDIDAEKALEFYHKIL